MLNDTDLYPLAGGGPPVTNGTHQPVTNVVHQSVANAVHQQVTINGTCPPLAGLTSKLPQDILKRITDSLSSADIAGLCRTCKADEAAFFQILYDRVIIYLRDYMMTGDINDQLNTVRTSSRALIQQIRDVTIFGPGGGSKRWITAFPRMALDTGADSAAWMWREALSVVDRWLLRLIPADNLEILRFGDDCPTFIPYVVLKTTSQFKFLTFLDMPFYNMEYDYFDAIPTTFFPDLRTFIARGVGTCPAIVTVHYIILATKRLERFAIYWHEPNILNGMNLSSPMIRRRFRNIDSVADLSDKAIYGPLLEHERLRSVNIGGGQGSNELAGLMRKKTIKELNVAWLVRCSRIFPKLHLSNPMPRLTKLTIRLCCNEDCAKSALNFANSVPAGLVTFVFHVRPDNGAFQDVDDFKFRNTSALGHFQWWNFYANAFVERHQRTLKELSVLVKPELRSDGYASTIPWEQAINYHRVKLDLMRTTWDISFSEAERTDDDPLGGAILINVDTRYYRILKLLNVQTLLVCPSNERRIAGCALYENHIALLIAQQFGNTASVRPVLREIGITTGNRWCGVHTIVWNNEAGEVADAGAEGPFTPQLVKQHLKLVPMV
ncbi:hypothetical protein Dda_0714 [Drechslerella dactyloides]|uniref:F-box domain-containing protein n=1 Tax=Drechslerella dactyloides TaxID=74499 RepID=A0AAD6J825_DREDA|nr:hypothetical protein Dda_0714 [Drechslerella dactyloides]